MNFFCLLIARKLKNELVRTSRNGDSREAENWSLGTSPRVVSLIPRGAGSISSLYGAKASLKEKKYSYLFAT